jgi:hypothetical protein
MAVAIRTLAEDALVLLRRPRIVPVEVSRREFGLACKKNHGSPNVLDVFEASADATDSG